MPIQDALQPQSADRHLYRGDDSVGPLPNLPNHALRCEDGIATLFHTLGLRISPRLLKTESVVAQPPETSLEPTETAQD